MHKKIAKAVTSSLMAASMVASSVAALIPMSAAAGNCLGRTASMTESVFLGIFA